MKQIHRWWDEMPGERFWLGITGGDGRNEWFASPCGAGRNTAGRAQPLITHVMDGDVVFHYDDAQHAIVAWSTSRGRVEKRRLGWSGHAHGDEHSAIETRMLPSWAVALTRSTPLEAPVPLEEIARVQWELFPALRAFEDQVGEPLYYPFTMGSKSETRLLPGYAFKLPALFIRSFPPLAGVAEQMAWDVAARAGKRAWADPRQSGAVARNGRELAEGNPREAWVHPHDQRFPA